MILKMVYISKDTVKVPYLETKQVFQKNGGCLGQSTTQDS